MALTLLSDMALAVGSSLENTPAASAGPLTKTSSPEWLCGWAGLRLDWGFAKDGPVLCEDAPSLPGDIRFH